MDTPPQSPYGYPSTPSSTASYSSLLYSPQSDTSTSASTISNYSQDEIEQLNSKLFVKFVPSELTHNQLLCHFGKFGNLIMMSLNTKRHNVLLEYETRDMAVKAKRDGKIIKGDSGKIYHLQIFWGKKIMKPLPPPIYEIPTLEQFAENCQKYIDQAMKLKLDRPPPGFENYMKEYSHFH